MYKTWGEIKNETLNLGFEKMKAYDKNKQSFIDAYNFAQTLIASTIGGIIKKIDIVCNKSDFPKVFDLAEITDDFLSLSQTYVINKNTNGRLDNITFTDNRFLTVPKEFVGVISVSYYATPTKITISSDENTPCLLPYKWANLMPYLMANRLFLDDDAGKAGYYWNLFEDMKNSILSQENTPIVTVNSDMESRWDF